MNRTCYVIGSGSLTRACCEHLIASRWTIFGLVTGNVELQQWADQNAIAALEDFDKLSKAMTGAPGDVLFSIINPDKVPADLLALPSIAAINYHDAPLPAYAGLNATSWAIQNGESKHGVSWHLMTERFDAGDLLLQSHFEIDPEETAFTLNLKCHEQGLETFHQLLRQLADHSFAGTPQDSRGRVSTNSGRRRPDGAALIDWRRSAVQIDALVRGLSFGPERNPLGSPKVALEGVVYIVSETTIRPVQANEPPGTIIAVNDDGVAVATAEGVLVLTELRSSAGQLITLSDLQTAEHFSAGRQFELWSDETLTVLAEQDKHQAREEPYWIDALRQVEPLNPFTHHASDEHSGSATDFVALPDDLITLIGSSKDSIAGDSAEMTRWVAAIYYCYLSRLCRSSASVASGAVALYTETDTGDVAVLPCAPRPFQRHLQHSDSVSAAVTQVLQAITDIAQRPGPQDDLVYRNPGLTEPDYPVSIALAPARARAGNSALCLGADAASSRVGFAYRPSQLAAEVVARHVDCFVNFARQALAAPDRSLADCVYMDDDELRQTLSDWNATAAEVPTDSVVVQIERQADRRSSDVALAYRDQTLTYGELSLRAKALATALVEDGVSIDQIVGIYLPRSVDMVVAMVAVGYAGAAYVPLDPSYPSDRIQFMIDDASLAHIVTDDDGRAELQGCAAKLWNVEQPPAGATTSQQLPVAVGTDALAYVIYTSGSTGNPKGVMVEHGNLNNFLVAMDQALDYQGNPGVWLAVTSISFDISVLELLWTLARGFKVVVQEDTLAARSVARSPSVRAPIDFSLFYFSSDTNAGADQSSSSEPSSRYRLLLEGARYADANGFSAVWTPERHFHSFGGLYPNPSVTSAAIAAVTERLAIRAGSIVLPLHHPLRVAEEWSVVDNLSNGRVGFSFASGWHANDFALQPEHYANRKRLMLEGIDTVLDLWRGNSLTLMNGEGESFAARVFPPPVQREPPIWITAAGNVETFEIAGRSGHNLLTNLLGQTVDQLKIKIAAYRAARADSGHPGQGTVSVMLHTFIGTDIDSVRELVRGPFCAYLKSSFDLVKIAPWAFPAFAQPSQRHAQDSAFDPDSFTEADIDALVDHAFERYFDTAGLFGTPESVLPLVTALQQAGVTELACLIDFGVAEDAVLESLEHLNVLRRLAQPALDSAVTERAETYSIAQQIKRHQVTHFQCTPSMAQVIWSEAEDAPSFEPLTHILLGGEALPSELAERVRASFEGRLINVYGPTETTIWSTFTSVDSQTAPDSIGVPLANTSVYILDADDQPLPWGLPGELCIGGDGVARGYLDRPEMTAERFVTTTLASERQRVYRTGDLAAWRRDGTLQFLGRLDHQVKLRGFRIELGEIENTVAALPEVAQCTVVAQNQGTPEAQLMAYVVPAVTANTDAVVSRWERLWDDAYRLPAKPSAVAENTAGWLDSFTGEPHSDAHMREWLDETCERIQALNPKSMLEIGCGTGMLLYKLAPACERYVATDISATAIEGIAEVLKSQPLAQVELLRAAAHELESLPDDAFDTIVLNSVVQYFPSAEYLLDVIAIASRKLAPNGRLFLGDIRSKQHLPLFYQQVEWHRSADTDSVHNVQQRIAARAQSERELTCDPAFFEQLGGICPELVSWRYALKHAAAHTEMSLFRYDVVLSTRPEPSLEHPWAMLDALADPSLNELSELVSRVRANDAPVRVLGLRNARLWTAVERDQQMADAGSETTIAALRTELPSFQTAVIDPAKLAAALSTHRTTFSWGADTGLMDLEVWPSELANSAVFKPIIRAPAAALISHCSVRARKVQDRSLPDHIRQHLKAVLPDYMVPARIMTIAAMPLTPNGKVDRLALPDPAQFLAAAAPSQPPRNDIEQQIAVIFAKLLGLPSISTQANFFELGANSLLMVQARSQLNQQLQRHVPLVNLYRYPTVASLAQALTGSAESQKGSLDAGQPLSTVRQTGTSAKALDRAQRRKAVRSGRRRGHSGKAN